jgi:hypothetical protein
MKIIKVNAYEYKELNDRLNFKLKFCLMKFHLITTQAKLENGKSIMKYDYVSEWNVIL